MTEYENAQLFVVNSEALNPKSETNSKFKVKMTKTEIF